MIKPEAVKTKRLWNQKIKKTKDHESPKNYEPEKSPNLKKDHKPKDLEKIIKHEDENPKDHETKNVETRRSKN